MQPLISRTVNTAREQIQNRLTTSHLFPCLYVTALSMDTDCHSDRLIRVSVAQLAMQQNAPRDIARRAIKYQLTLNRLILFNIRNSGDARASRSPSTASRFGFSGRPTNEKVVRCRKDPSHASSEHSLSKRNRAGSPGQSREIISVTGI